MNYKAPTKPSTKTETPAEAKGSTSSQSTTHNTPSIVTKPKTPGVNVASEILDVTMMIGGFLISKYIF